jgi:hypothetical protein
MTTKNEDKEQAERDEAARRSAPKQQQPQQNQPGRASETARAAGYNQDDKASQQTPGGVSREELGLPEWQEDEALKERQRVDIQADQDALTEDESQPSK